MCLLRLSLVYYMHVFNDYDLFLFAVSRYATEDDVYYVETFCILIKTLVRIKNTYIMKRENFSLKAMQLHFYDDLYKEITINKKNNKKSQFFRGIM